MAVGPSSSGDPLQDHFQRCLVQVLVGGQHSGSGFFVARGRVLTCAHVVEPGQQVTVVWESQPAIAQILRRLPEQGAGNPYPYPDLCLLQIPYQDHPCVRLDEQEPTLGPPPDRLRAAGFTQVFEKGPVRLTPITCEFEGLLRGGDGDRLQVKGGQTVAGMSGSPLLSERSCRVVGMVATTRERSDDLGAWAVPTKAILEHLPRLGEEQERFHADDASWRSAAAAAHLGDVLRPAYQELPKQAMRAPSLLLLAKYGVVPFHQEQRAQELQALLDWCGNPEAASLQLVVGQAGAGKTRLAAQLCREMAGQGWLTGFLSDQAPAGSLDRIRQLGEPTLLVLDYAETRSELPILLQSLLAAEGEEKPLRLLLLARGAGDWWRELPTKLSDSQLLLAGVGVRELTLLAPQISDRKAVYQAAARAFRNSQGLSHTEGLRLPDLQRPEFGVALHLHMAALDAVGTREEPGLGPAALGRASPLSAVLEREARYWVRSASAQHLPHRDRVLRRVVAVASLFGASDEGEAAATLARVPDLEGSSAEQRRDLARWHHDLYPGPEWLSALQPDALAEELVAQVLEDCPELSRSGFRGLPPAQAVQALTALDRAALVRPHLEPAMMEVLASDLERLGFSAITVAVETGDPIGLVLAKLLKAKPPKPNLAVQLLAQIPWETVALRELALILSTAAVDRARGMGDAGALAAALINSHQRLRDVDLHEEALDAIQEAVAIYRGLSETQPEATMPDLAWSLDILSGSYAWKGWDEEALAAIEEAVSIYRQLPAARPDLVQLDLSGSLNDLGHRLGNLGHHEAAVARVQHQLENRRHSLAAGDILDEGALGPATLAC